MAYKIELTSKSNHTGHLTKKKKKKKTTESTKVKEIKKQINIPGGHS